MSRENNIIMLLIEEKMREGGWTAYTPESYAGYLFRLSDEEIIEYVCNIVEGQAGL